MTRDHWVVGIAIAAVLWCAAPTAGNVFPAPGQQEPPAEPLKELRQRLEEARTRLNLTDEQVEQIRPILQGGFKVILGVLQEHVIDLQDRRPGGANRLRLWQLRRLQRDLNAVRKQTLENLEEVLTDEQLEIYKEIQEENRQALRERLPQRR